MNPTEFLPKSMSFDPLQTWLGISSTEQPPNHYRLLGVALYEVDPTVIRQGAEQQLERIRPHSQGVQGSAAAQVMGDIAAARTCLLSPPHKAQYDATLRQQPQAATPVAAIAPAVAQSATPVAVAAVETAAQVADPDKDQAEPAAALMARMGAKRRLSPPVIVGSVLAALAMIVIAVLLFSGGGSTEEQTADTDTDDTSKRDDSETKSSKPVTAELKLRKIPTQTTAPHEPVLVTVDVENHSASKSPLKFRLDKKVPRGVKIDEKTGQITWRPTAKHANRRHQFKVYASAGKQQAERLVTILVEPDAIPPHYESTPTITPDLDPDVVPVIPNPDITPQSTDPPTDPPTDPAAPVERIVRIAVPAEAELVEARRLADQVYVKQLADATSATDRIAIANRMLESASNSTSSAAERYVLLEKSLDALGREGATEEGLTAIDRLDEQFEVDAIAKKAEFLTAAAARAATSTDTAKPFVLAATKMANDAARTERFDEAIEALRLANTAARRAGLNDLARLALQRRRELEKINEQFAPVIKAREALAKDADDPSANFYVGRWEAFVQGDWAKGLASLKRGSNAVLKKLASDELADPQQADARVALADQWWDLSLKTDGVMRDQIQKHAIEWYKKALPDLSGLATQAAQQRIDQYEASGADSDLNPDPDEAGN